MNNYVKTFLRGSAISLAGAVFLGIVNYFVRRILCNSMSLADYGVFFSIFALLSMGFGFTDLGLTQSGTVMIAAAANELETRSSVFSQLFFIKGTLAILCALCFFIFLWITQPELNQLFILFFLLYFIFQVFNGTLQALWNGLKEYTLQQIRFSAIAVLTLIPLLLIKRVELPSAAGSFLFAAAIVFFSGLICSKYLKLGNLKFHIDKKICKQLLTTGGLIAVTTTLLSLMYNLSTIMLNWQKGAESAGLYNVALPIMQIVQAAMIFPAVFLPIAVEMEKKQEYTKLRSFVFCALLLALAALLPVGLFFHCCSPWLISVLFKPEYTGAATATTLLCLGLVFFTLGNFLFQIMLSLHKTVIMAVIAGITAIGNLGLNFFLIKYFDVNGAAWATCGSYLIFALLTYIALINELKKLMNVQEV